VTLEFARSLRVEPGTNPRGEQADTSWLFLLPSLDVDEAVVAGTAPAGTMVALAGVSRRLRIVLPARAMRRRLSRLERSGRLAVTISSDPVEDASDPPDLVYLDPGVAARFAADESAVLWLASVLAANGAVYIAPGGRGGRRAAYALVRELGVDVAVRVGLSGADGDASAPPQGVCAAWLIPASPPPPPRWAQPVFRAARLVRRLASRLLPGDARAAAAGRVSDPQRSLGVAGIGALDAQLPRGLGVLVRATPEEAVGELPGYVTETARAAGVPVTPAGWRLAPPRGYRSQKVIFFVRRVEGPDLVVKLTQDERFNHMLENEARALGALEEEDLGTALTPPGVAFHAHHGRLLIVGEDAVVGGPFVDVAEPGPESPQALAVVRTLTEIGARTRRPGDGVAEALLDVVAAYARIYSPPAAVDGALKRAARLLGGLGAGLPTVFMHGDATVYNTLVDARGRIGLVDWENAESTGLPLWDLLHFLHSHESWTAERAGLRYTPMHLRRELEESAPDSPRGEAIESYRAAVRVPAEALRPLTYTWLARHAVRQARELPARRLESGFYHRLLAQLLMP